MGMLRKHLFKGPKADWTDREAWSRRAMLWKVVAMAMQADNKDKQLIHTFNQFLKADQSRAPTEDELHQVCGWLQNFIIEKHNASKIEIAKD